MKVAIKTNKNGYCEYFKIDNKKFGAGIYELNIKINPGELPEILIKAVSDKFILDSEDAKLYLDSKEVIKNEN